MKVYDLGDAILIETEIKVKQPFEDEPEDQTEVDSVTLEIYNDGSKILDTSMERYDTGRYHYTWDTVDEEEGYYLLKIIPEYSGTQGVETETIELEKDNLE